MPQLRSGPAKSINKYFKKINKGGKNEAPTGDMTCPRSHSQLVVETGFKGMPPVSQARTLGELTWRKEPRMLSS